MYWSSTTRETGRRHVHNCLPHCIEFAGRVRNRYSISWIDAEPTALA